MGEPRAIVAEKQVGLLRGGGPDEEAPARETLDRVSAGTYQSVDTGSIQRGIDFLLELQGGERGEFLGSHSG